MTVPPTTTNHDLYEALERMEAKLMTALNAGLNAVNLAITSLATAHHQALIDQERRNSSFADRDRVEQVAIHVHDNGNELMSLTKRISDNDKATGARLVRLEELVESRHILFTANTIGYTITFLAILVSAIVAFVLAHNV